MKNLIRKLHIYYLRTLGRGKPELRIKGMVVIIAPHPDDEVIGCGGLIARLVTERNTPHIIILTGGEGSHRGCCDIETDEIKRERRKLTDNALRVLNVDREFIHELDFPDGDIYSSSKRGASSMEVDRLEKLLFEIQPDTILVPHWGEGWPDHVNTVKIVNAIAPKQVSIYEYCVWMWYYNVWRGLDWKNAFRLRMTPRERQLKLEAMDVYTKLLAPCGKPWSGVLPKLLVKANSGNTELYFKIR